MKATTHVKEHARFYAPAVLGIVAWLLGSELVGSVRTLFAGILFFFTHLVLVAWLALPSAHEAFRRRAMRGDEGMPIIALIAVVVVAVSLSAVFGLLNHHERPAAVQLVMATVLVPLGWFMLHTVFAFHYAHAWFGNQGEDGKPGTGIVFPGGEEPRAWDFLYYSFVVGMTAQVSDASVTTWRMRRLTLAHGVVSFFYNTVILALTVNAVVVLAP